MSMFGGSYHACEAFDSYDQAFEDGYRSWSNYSEDNPKGSSFNPNAYYLKIDFISIKHSTEKAYLVNIRNNLTVWIPKKITRQVGKCTMFVHRDIYKQILSKEKERINESLPNSTNT